VRQVWHSFAWVTRAIALVAATWVGSLGGPTYAQTAAGTFNPGIYYRLPNISRPEAQLVRLADPLLHAIQMSPVGWDMCGDVVVAPSPDGLELTPAGGRSRSVRTEGIFRVARPSFSPDCRYVAVQASATVDIIDDTEDLNIYVIDVETSGVVRVGDLPWNEESPRFFPIGVRLAYSSFSPTEGVNLHVYDVDEGREILRADGIGALQIAISPNGDRILDPRRMRLYDASTGAVVGDFLTALLDTLPATGFSLDERFKDEPGMPDRGLYPLDASFSPDGAHVVLDWPLRRDDQFGNVLMRLALDDRQLSALTDLIPTNPEFTNHNNFSQLNPLWK
jgi:hypothetical protein